MSEEYLLGNIEKKIVERFKKFVQGEPPVTAKPTVSTEDVQRYLKSQGLKE